MQLYQNPIDEHLLWDYLQTKQWNKATELIEWYYSRTNPDGFDDPNNIRNAERLQPSHEITISKLDVRTGKGTPKVMLYIFAALLLFFGFISIKYGTINGMIIPAIFSPIAIYAVYTIFIDRTNQITFSDEHIEFRKSNKKPISWNNILAIYYYYRGTGGVSYPGSQSAEFIIIWKKDAVKPESYYLNYLDQKPEDIVWLTNKLWKEKTKI